MLTWQRDRGIGCAPIRCQPWVLRLCRAHCTITCKKEKKKNICFLLIQFSFVHLFCQRFVKLRNLCQCLSVFSRSSILFSSRVSPWHGNIHRKSVICITCRRRNWIKIRTSKKSHKKRRDSMVFHIIWRFIMPWTWWRNRLLLLLVSLCRWSPQISVYLFFSLDARDQRNFWCCCVHSKLWTLPSSPATSA